MTIRISVKNLSDNDGEGENSVISVKAQTPDGRPVADDKEVQLKGGEKAAKEIRAGQRLVVDVVKSSEEPKVAKPLAVPTEPPKR